MSGTDLLIFVVALATTIWVWRDARAKARTSDDGRVGGIKPWQWVCMCLAIWIIAFPWYLFARREQASKEPLTTPSPPETRGRFGALETQRPVSQQERVQEEIQASWENRTTEDLLAEARSLTEQYKATHDESLPARIQALRRTASERATPKR
jgi:hypothetical protein